MSYNPRRMSFAIPIFKVSCTGDGRLLKPDDPIEGYGIVNKANLVLAPGENFVYKSGMMITPPHGYFVSVLTHPTTYMDHLVGVVSFNKDPSEGLNLYLHNYSTLTMTLKAETPIARIILFRDYTPPLVQK